MGFRALNVAISIIEVWGIFRSRITRRGRNGL
jgi:hypothetical protein